MAHHRARDGAHLPLAARRRPASCERARRGSGRAPALRRALRRVSARAAGLKAPSSRFSSTVMNGNRRPPSGTITRPRADDVVRGHAADVARLRMSRARVARDEAGDRAQQRRLAGAVGADDRDDLRPCRRVNADVAQHRQRARSRRATRSTTSSRSFARASCRDRPRSPRACSASSSALPSAILAPWSSTITRFENARTTLRLCSMMRNVRPARCRRPHQLDHVPPTSARVEPGHHLVEQDDLRLERERARDLQPAPLRQRQFARRRRRPDRARPTRSSTAQRALSASRSFGVVQERADHHVLERGQRDQRLGDLEGAAHAELRALVGGKCVDQLARGRRSRRSSARAGRSAG